MSENYSFEFINHNYTEEAFNYITKEVASITTPVPANLLLSHPANAYNINISNNAHNMNNNNSYMNSTIMMMNNLNDQIMMANLAVDNNYPQNILCNNNDQSPLNNSSSSVSSTSSLSSPSPTSSPTSLSNSIDYQKLKSDLSLLKPKSELIVNNNNINNATNNNHYYAENISQFQQTEASGNNNNVNGSFSLHSSTPCVPLATSSPVTPKKRRSSSNSINPEVIQSLSNSLLNNNTNTNANNNVNSNNISNYVSDQANILLSSFANNNNNSNSNINININANNNKEEEGKEVNNLQISPFVSSVTENYCDITEYLTLPQNQAAKKLQMRPSTFSKRWKEASRNRKWPWRNVRKIDKEITCILHNTPKNGCLTDEVEVHLTTLLRQRQEELRPVVIRIS